MKGGDMAQLEDECNDRNLRRTIALGGGMIALLMLATGIGLFLGWMIWGAL